jgi:hypothetical protein
MIYQVSAPIDSPDYRLERQPHDGTALDNDSKNLISSARLQTMLERYRDRWSPSEIHLLAEYLTGFAKSLKETHGERDRQK